MINLYLIRHASADERGPKYPDDGKRPLIAKGHKQAKALARVLDVCDIKFDRLFSSPYTRAAQTAEPLSSALKKGRGIQYLDALADDDYPQLLVDIGEWVASGDSAIALVGHEPYMSELGSYLLTGDEVTAGIRFKKAAMLSLAGALKPGQMSLQAFLPASVYKYVRSD